MLTKLLFSLFCLTCLTTNTVFAEIYKYRDADGSLYITDKKMNASYKLLSIFRPHLNQQSNTQHSLAAYKRNQRDYLPDIHRAAKVYRIDPSLLHAIVDIESAFNPNALSKTGAVGLMQLMPNTAKELGVHNSWNPQQNIKGGARFFRQLLDTFKQNITLSLAAYNAGAGAVKRAGYNIPPYPETQRYVKKVIKRYAELKTSN